MALHSTTNELRVRKIQRLVIFSTLLLTTSLTYAVAKDETYYKEHPGEAKAKYEACQQRVAELAAAGKIEEMMQVAEDPECKAADRVITTNQNSN